MKVLTYLFSIVIYKLRVFWNRGAQDRPRGIASEIDFWNSKLANISHYLERLDPQLLISGHLSQLLEKVPGDICKIIDVGAGPLTAVGKKHDKKKIELIATDVLGDVYQDILKRHKIVPPVSTIACPGEALVDRFGSGIFDVAISQNALDHTEDPMVVLEQMIKLIKPGGFVLLQHREREATQELWAGMHKWDFFSESGEFLMKGIKRTYHAKKYLASRYPIEMKVWSEKDWVYVEIHKTQ